MPGTRALEVIRVSDPIKVDFDRLQQSMSRTKGRLVTQAEVVEELLKVYRHVEGD